MAEQDEAIKIVVEVVDKFSKPLADLKKDLDRLDDRGGQGASKIKKNFDGLREAVVNVGGALNATLVPALRALGIGFAGIGATIATAVTALKGFAGSTETLSRLNRETGIGIDRMRELEAVGRRLNVSAGEMRQGFRDFAAEMHKTRLGIGDMGKELRLRGLFGFEEQLRHAKTNAEALDITLKELDKIHDPQHRRDFLNIMRLPPGLADANAKERARLIDEYRKTVGATSTEDEAAAARFEKSIWDMGNAWEKFVLRMSRNNTLDRLATSLTTIAGLVDRIVEADKRFQQVWKNPEPGSIPDKLWGPRSEKWHLPSGKPGESLWDRFWRGWNEGYRKVEPGYPAAGATDPKKMSYTGGAGEAPLVRASLVGGDEKAKETIKDATAEGIVEGLKKWALDAGGGTDRIGGGGGGGSSNFGGARVIRASLGVSAGDREGATTHGDGGKAVPSHILAEAQKVAAAGGPGAVAAYMRQQGYPKSGAWCGEFAAAVVRGAGGTPPAHPEVASNWRNFGERVYGTPQPGDIAVRRGTPTGSTSPHGHVTVVEKYDPKTGRFTGIGGNQGRLRSEYGTQGPRGYDFYRSKPDANVATPPPVAKPQSDTMRPPAVPRERMMDAAARRSQFARIEGSASVRIDLAGFARDGARSGTGAGRFSEVELHRGSTVPLASEST